MNRALPTVSIIIVNLNSGNLLRNCIKSIIYTRQNGYILSEVIIVDNGSTDRSLDKIENNLDINIIIEKNKENRGFAVACNQGAKLAKGDYLLFLNPDTELYDNSILDPISFFNKPENANVGICGIKNVDKNGNTIPSCSRFPSLWRWYIEILGLHRMFPTFGLGCLMSDMDHSLSCNIDQIIGAFFFVRSTLFEELHGFDERYFVYCEEVDFSLRALKAGWTSYHLASTSVYHMGGGVSRKMKAERLYHNKRSKILYGFKHFGLISAWSLLLGILVLEPVMRIMYFLVKGSWLDICHLARGNQIIILDMRSILTLALGKQKPDSINKIKKFR